MLSTAAVVNTPVFKDGGQTTLMCCNVAILLLPKQVESSINLEYGMEIPKSYDLSTIPFFQGLACTIIPPK